MRHGYSNSNNYTVYYYITNLQGDVIRLVDVNGSTAAYYEYDPYGNAITASGSHANINPLRYRGYVYDYETELYYLQSRYYDPELGRFINADAFAATGQGLLGNNMFVYCNNNPVCCCDPTGYWSTLGRIGNPHAMMRGGGCYEGWIIPDRIREAEELEDQAKQLFNTSEAAVLNADYFAFYQGVLVIKIPAMETSAFSFGIILMGSKVPSSNLVRHEFGHTRQLAELGPIGYTYFVVLPSVTCYWLTQQGVLPDEMYYSLPWEYTANMYGNANGTYMSWADSVANQYWSMADIISHLHLAN